MMKPIAVLTLAVCLGAVPAFAALKPGDAAPDFDAQASLGGNVFTFSLSDALKKGPVVLLLPSRVHDRLHDRGA